MRYVLVLAIVFTAITAECAYLKEIARSTHDVGGEASLVPSNPTEKKRIATCQLQFLKTEADDYESQDEMSETPRITVTAHRFSAEAEFSNGLAIPTFENIDAYGLKITSRAYLRETGEVYIYVLDLGTARRLASFRANINLQKDFEAYLDVNGDNGVSGLKVQCQVKDAL